MGCRPSTPEVITVTPEEPPPSEVPSDPPPPKQRSYRPSIASLQLPTQDDLSSECLTDRSSDQEVQENQDYLCGTDVSLQWLLQALADKFSKQFDEEPQWITERLNRPRWDDYATSTVLRVTFGWEDEDLPKSVVLKTPAHKSQREDEDAKYHYLMFKRECNVYDWTQKYPKLPAPKIYHIKRHTKDFSGVVVMEDIGERGVQQDAVKGLSVDAARDLLRQLAVLHATSMKHTGWSTTVADLPPSYYSSLIGNYDDMVTFFEHHDVDHSRFEETAKYFTADYLHDSSTDAAEKLPPRVFLHGEPYASNIFVVTDNREQQIAAVIDWTESHSGCFGEDIAKAICWNLATKAHLLGNREYKYGRTSIQSSLLVRTTANACHVTMTLKNSDEREGVETLTCVHYCIILEGSIDRLEHTSSLLEEYHFYLVQNSPEEYANIAIETVRKAFDTFLPMAMVTLLYKVVAMKNKEDIEPLIDRAKGLIQNVYTMSKLLET